MSTTYFDYYGNPVAPAAGVTFQTKATAAGQTLAATGSQSQVQDVAGGDVLVGGPASTNLVVTDPTTTVIQGAHTGVSTVTAWTSFALPSGVDDLYMDQSNSTAIGNAAENLIVAAGSSDLVSGGGGNDVLVDAGAGGDRFEFAPGGGNAVIYGFQTSGTTHDFLSLGAAYGLNDFSQLASHLSQQGADVLLTLSASDSVLIRNTQVSSLTAQDFMLPVDTSKLILAFDDEFNGLSLYNPATGQGVWKTSYGTNTAVGSGSFPSHTIANNAEQEIYVDPGYAGSGSTPLGLNPFSISNGVLTITASKTPAADLTALNGYQYVSGLLTTQNSFAQTYGYFEMKAELPTGQGVWPAFWMAPVSNTGSTELDVMETIGDKTVYNTAHYDTLSGKAQAQWASAVAGVGAGFHTYGLLWTAQNLTWYMDGQAVASMATPAGMNQPMYMMVNLAVGGNWPGSPPASFTSAAMQIDYIHAYSLSYNATSSTDRPTDPLIIAVNSAYSYSLVGTSLQTLTLTGSGNLTGTANNLGDHITGNTGSDTLVGGAGADLLDASRSGSSVLDGGAGGQDTLIGGAGNDTFIVANASDVVTAAAGHQNVLNTSVSFHTPANIQTVYLTGSANLTVWANNTGDTICTNTGSDTVYGGAGNDIFATGATGVATLVAGTGTDTFWIENAADVILNVPVGSKDLVQSTVSYHLPDNARTLMLEGGASLDGWAGNTDATLIGNSAANHLYAGAGNDILTGAGGADTFVFGLGGGKATITDFGQNGAQDVVDISALLNAGDSASLAQSGSNMVITLSNGETITLVNVTAGILTATAQGYAANLPVASTSYTATSSSDLPASLAVDTINSAYSYTLPSTFAHTLTLTGNGDLTATGNALGDHITGNTGADTLIGGAGSDLLDASLGGNALLNTGQGGADTLIGGAGNDTFVTSTAAVATLIAGTGTDTFWIQNAADVITNVPVGSKDLVQSTVSYHLPDNARTLMLQGVANLDGWAGATDATVVGNSAANHLYAGAGTDILTGAGGDDTFVFGLGSGKAVITDFGQGGDHDVLDISAFLGAGDTATLTQAGANAVVALSNGESITLNNTLVSSLTATVQGYAIPYVASSSTDRAPASIVAVNSAYSYSLVGTSLQTLTLTGSGNLTGTANNLGDHITGNTGSDTLVGGAGADLLDASRSGSSVLDGGAGGQDTLIGGAGNDTFIVANASDVVTAAAGHQNVLNTSVSFHTPANIQTVYLTGSANLTVWANDTGDKILTNTGNDTVYGGAGNDTFATGVTGVETLVAGKGTDTFWIENAADVILNVPVGSKDLVQSTVSYHLPDNARTLMLEGGASLDGWAGNTDATLIGNSAANHLYAGAGANILTGAGGDDTFVFGVGSGNAAITDFGQSGDHDVIDISALLNAGDTAALSQLGANALITLSNGETITLLGVQASTLTHTAAGYMH